MAEKQTNKDRMREIVDSIENGIKELFESDKYRQYLSTMSRFHRYSVNNTMLIYMQRPDATHVAGFNKWRNQFGRNVLKGEKGIRIIAPTPYKKKVEEIKTDPETNAPVLDADGKAIIEEKEIRIPMFKVVSVFDVSQTSFKLRSLIHLSRNCICSSVWNQCSPPGMTVRSAWCSLANADTVSMDVKASSCSVTPDHCIILQISFSISTIGEIK